METKMLILVLLSLSFAGSSAVKVVVQKKQKKLRAHEALQVKGNYPPSDYYLEFGLIISSYDNDLKIESKKLDKESMISGDLKGSECKASPVKTSTRQPYFLMKGIQASGIGYMLKFKCKGVSFKPPNREACVCDFTVQINWVGRYRKFADSCKPAYCLTDNFWIVGGFERRAGADYYDPNTASKFPGQCDKNDFCRSWDDFKTGFNNENGRTDARFAYGEQVGLGKVVTFGGYKWFFALIIEYKKQDLTKAVMTGRGTLDGMWVPASSGGQASFSEAMHWEDSEAKASSSSVTTSLKLGASASYAGASTSVDVDHGWSEAAQKTNTDTNGGDSSRTCAAYQCEGGTTWQWKMKFENEHFKTDFDNCIFVCTPDQGNFPKCPFGACCSSESRKDECSTCSTLWCRPEKLECPLHKDHKDHKLYCGEKDDYFIDFLKTLRERVEARARVNERDTHSLRHLRGERRIDELALHGYAELYKNNFKHQDLTGASEAQQLKTQIQGDLSGLALKVMKKRLEEVREYLEVEHNRNSDFDFEQAQKRLGETQWNPCANEKKKTEGSALWCHCHQDGRKVRWMPGDKPNPNAKIVKETEKQPKEQKGRGKPTTDEEAYRKQEATSPGSPEPSDCFEPHLKDSKRFKHCHWVGDSAHGSCCSKQKGCEKGETLDREYFKIREIDLAAEDFSKENLERANIRFRTQCYYKVETDKEYADRIRRTHEYLETNLLKKNKRGHQPKITKQQERDKLFLCFKKFFESKPRMFSLQSIDRMLVEETMSCEDRLVNRNCIRKHKIRKAEDDSDIDSGGSGSSGGDDDGDDGIEDDGNDGIEAFEGGDERVCCLIKGAKNPRLSDECSEKEGDKEVSPLKCLRFTGSDKDDVENEDKDGAENEDKDDAENEDKDDAENEDDKKKVDKQKDEGGEDSVGNVEKEQDRVQDEKLVPDNSADNKKKGGKKCCRRGNDYVEMNECRGGREEAPQNKCRKKKS